MKTLKSISMAYKLMTYTRVGSISYVGKHLSLRGGGIDFEGPWTDLGGEPKESPSLRGGIRKFDQF